PLRRAHAAPRRAGCVPQGARDPDGRALPCADPSPARRRALRAVAAARDGAARRRDPHAADLRRPYRRRDRRGGDGGQGVLRSLMPGSPLRILQLYPKGDFFTGAAIQLRDLAAGLAARGHPVAGVRRVGYTTGRVQAIVAVCESIKRGLVAGGVPAGKIEVIYSGTDLERFHPGVDGGPIRRELGLGRDDRLVTQVGVRSWRG